jgi:hypothetical protein
MFVLECNLVVCFELQWQAAAFGTFFIQVTLDKFSFPEYFLNISGTADLAFYIVDLSWWRTF